MVTRNVDFVEIEGSPNKTKEGDKNEGILKKDLHFLKKYDNI